MSIVKQGPYSSSELKKTRIQTKRAQSGGRQRECWGFRAPLEPLLRREKNSDISDVKHTERETKQVSGTPNGGEKTARQENREGGTDLVVTVIERRGLAKIV